MIQFLFLIFFIFAGKSSLASDAHFSTQWKKLYHFEMRSEERFYFSQDPQNLQIEVRAAEKAFAQEEYLDTDRHPQCLFPARYQLLKKNSKVKFRDSKCPSFDSWIKDLAPEGISLIFAGNYPDNPGSIFGHTFLKIHTNPHSRLQSEGNTHSPILDYALNYAAAVDDEIGLLYAFKGLLGGYKGFFSMDPYYVKVNEYSEGEGRDIWEYKLNINPNESWFMLAHFWELKYRSSFDYYFLDDNCSFLVLGLIDATKPEWKLIEGDPTYVIPLETVKHLKSIPGSITHINYRPSIRKKAIKAYADLKLTQKNEVVKVLSFKESPSEIKDVEVLNTLALSSLSKRSYHDGKLNPEDQNLLDRTLQRLSMLDTSQLALNPGTPSDPTESHGVWQIGLALGHQGTGYGQFHFRPGLHDLMDYQRGYLDYSELVVGDFNLRYQESKLSLQRVRIFELGLLRPITLREKAMSWRTRWDYQNQSQIFCNFCKSIYGEGSVGLSQNLSQKNLLYLLAGAFVNADSTRFAQTSSGGLLELGSIYTPHESLRLLTSVKSLYNLTHVQNGRTLYLLNLEATYHFTKDIDLNLASLSGITLSGSEKFQSNLLLSMDYHF